MGHVEKVNRTLPLNQMFFHATDQTAAAPATAHW
jgi:hypothetical protein